MWQFCCSRRTRHAGCANKTEKGGPWIESAEISPPESIDDDDSDTEIGSGVITLLILGASSCELAIFNSTTATPYPSPTLSTFDEANKKTLMNNINIT
jgi:hypothetical protein